MLGIPSTEKSNGPDRGRPALRGDRRRQPPPLRRRLHRRQVCPLASWRRSSLTHQPKRRPSPSDRGRQSNPPHQPAQAGPPFSSPMPSEAAATDESPLVRRAMYRRPRRRRCSPHQQPHETTHVSAALKINIRYSNVIRLATCATSVVEQGIYKPQVSDLAKNSPISANSPKSGVTVRRESRIS